jgi:sugar phosphate isomerase/epimerase
MIGLSTTYYATKGLSIYESVQRAAELGFDVIELGAAHAYEENVWDILYKTRKDFQHITFTIHHLFPPLREKIWFNTADGLITINKRIIDRLLKGASIMEASVISMHSPILNDVSVGDKVAGNFNRPVLGKPKDENACKKNFIQLMEYMNKKAEKSGIRVLIENMDTSFVNTFLSTKNSFLEVFDMFGSSGLLLDVGHALQCGNLHELLELNGNILEMHLHETGIVPERRKWAHLPIINKSYYEPLKKILKNNTVVLVFEHGADVSENDILNERDILESFLEIR